MANNIEVYSQAVAKSLWVARLIISVATAQKLSGKHGLAAQEIRDAIVCVRGLPFTWDHDPIAAGG